MAKKVDSQKILGAVAFISTSLYLFKSRKNKDSTKIEGLNIDIDPDKIIDKVKPYISSNPEINNTVADIAKKQIFRLLGQEAEEIK